MSEEAIDPKAKAWIDQASYEQLLERWRNDSLGDPIFTGQTGEYYSRRMREMRQANPEEHVRASKAIGWKGGGA